MKLISAMQVQLTEGEQANLWSKGTKNLKAYIHTLKSYDHLQSGNWEDSALAYQEAEYAIRADPKFPMAYVILAGVYVQTLWWEVGSARENATKKIQENIDIALSLDNENSSAYLCLSMLNFFLRIPDRAMAFMERSIELDPNFALAYQHYAMLLSEYEQGEKALRMINKGFRLDPIPSGIAYEIRGDVYYTLKRYEDAVNDYRYAADLEPNLLSSNIALVATYHRLGLPNKVDSAIKNVFKINPDFTIDSIYDPTTDPGTAKEGDFWDALREAGLR